MTVSLLALDRRTGALGVAVASRALAVGSRVPHVRTSVGAVAVQAFAPIGWGRRLLDEIAAGADPAALVASYPRLPEADRAQVAVLASNGVSAGFIGPGAEPHAGIAHGNGCCSAANLMERPGVPEAVVAAYETSTKTGFADRLVDGLLAADALGGDIRGRQSAAVLVAAPDDTDAADLRVDDHPRPTAELARLVLLRRADALVTASLVDGRYTLVEPLQEAVRLAPDDLGAVGALTLALTRARRHDEAVAQARHLLDLEPRTPLRIRMLVDSGNLAPDLGRVLLAGLGET